MPAMRSSCRRVPAASSSSTLALCRASAWLKGSAQLKRLDFGVGQGEWQDTEQVGNEVKINFVLLLKP